MTLIWRHLKLIILLAMLLAALGLSVDFQRIAAGIALFLLGMLMLEEGFKALGGSVLERLLARTTGTFPKAVSFGAIATSVTQSSSLVSVISISFLSAGLITLQAGLGIIFGANLGTTTGAWLIAGIGLKVDIAAYALPLLVLGALLVFQTSSGLRGAGKVLTGIGLIFLGIAFIKDGFDAFSAQFDLTRLAMAGIAGLLVYTLVGALATVVMQSSHAAMLLVIAALGAGQISYDNALAVAIGANVGTTVTALIGATQANYQGKRLALGHLIFNLVTGATALVLIVPLRLLVDGLSDAIGIAPEDAALRLAMFHTLFNLLGLGLMVPLRARLLVYLERRIAAPVPSVSRPRYINADLGDFPVTQLAALEKEVQHLQDNTIALISSGLNLRLDDLRASRDLALTLERSRDPVQLDFERRYYDKVKSLHAAIFDFCAKRSAAGLPPREMARLQELLEAANGLVRALKAVAHMRKNTTRFTSQPQGEVSAFYDALRLAMAHALVEITALAATPPAQRVSLALLDERQALEADSRALTQRLERMLQTRQISASHATSVLNDSAYAFDALRNLIDAARQLYRSEDAGEAEIERILEDQIDGLNKENAS
ncbi:MAG: Na/Pi cotransporter family protein [Rhodobacteraceae bacterium]|nr:MAG: Na/Pi cotransporter family protein [Paracoccaceae bacterium]